MQKSKDFMLYQLALAVGYCVFLLASLPVPGSAPRQNDLKNFKIVGVP
jgi:hypothetical protein